MIPGYSLAGSYGGACNFSELLRRPPSLLPVGLCLILEESTLLSLPTPWLGLAGSEREERLQHHDSSLSGNQLLKSCNSNVCLYGCVRGSRNGGSFAVCESCRVLFR